MKKYSRLFYLFPIILIFCLQISKADYLTDEKREFFLLTENYLFNDKFSQADSLVTLFTDNSPDDPGGYMMKASMMLSNSSDKEENIYGESFLKILDSIYIFTEQKLKNCDDTTAAWMYLFRGHARIYHSLYEARFGSGFSALKLAYKAKGNYENGLKRYKLYDLYMGLGGFHYWKSVKAGLLRTIGLFSNDKKKGIEELYLARDSSVISCYSSLNALIWIWMNEKKYDSSITACEELLGYFPDGKLFRWALAKSYLDIGNYPKAIEQYKYLREKLSQEPGNYYNLIECDYNLYLLYKKSKNELEIDKIVELFFKYDDKIPESIRDRQKDKIKKFEKLQ